MLPLVGKRQWSSLTRAATTAVQKKCLYELTLGPRLLTGRRSPTRLTCVSWRPRTRGSVLEALSQLQDYSVSARASWLPGRSRASRQPGILRWHHARRKRGPSRREGALKSAFLPSWLCTPICFTGGRARLVRGVAAYDKTAALQCTSRGAELLTVGIRSCRRTPRMSGGAPLFLSTMCFRVSFCVECLMADIHVAQNVPSVRASQLCVPASSVLTTCWREIREPGGYASLADKAELA